MSICLKDFYLFSNGRQRAPLYSLSGYVFDNEYLFPHTAKTAGKIFTVKNLDDGRVQDGDYLIIRLETNDKNMMFKFVYDVINKWTFDDYYELK